MFNPVPGIGRIVAKWRGNLDGRRRLAALPERMLKDIGLSHADAWQETQKPFWRN